MDGVLNYAMSTVEMGMRQLLQSGDFRSAGK